MSWKITGEPLPSEPMRLACNRKVVPGSSERMAGGSSSPVNSVCGLPPGGPGSMPI